jgi:hypothetical protein
MSLREAPKGHNGLFSSRWCTTGCGVLAVSPEELGASSLEILLRSEKILAEVKGIPRPFRLETDTMLARDFRKTAGDIRAAGEDDSFHLRSNRRQRSADIVAAVEKGGAPRVRHSFACHGH